MSGVLAFAKRRVLILSYMAFFTLVAVVVALIQQSPRYVSGALIQLFVASFFLPFFFGNVFCSRACWNGAAFELTAQAGKDIPKLKARSSVLAWSYLIALIIFALYVAQTNNPAMDVPARRIWLTSENILIVGGGFLLSLTYGTRAYCRLLCPFLTIVTIWLILSLVNQFD